MRRCGGVLAPRVFALGFHRFFNDNNSMCGIIGYVGKQQAAPILLDGLRRLEYRGYDSAGLALACDGQIKVRKKTGKIDQGLAPMISRETLNGSCGLGHTRWATHGP